jgi:hypothetical protein
LLKNYEAKPESALPLFLLLDLTANPERQASMDEAAVSTIETDTEPVQNVSPPPQSVFTLHALPLHLARKLDEILVHLGNQQAYADITIKVKRGRASQLTVTQSFIVREDL